MFYIKFIFVLFIIFNFINCFQPYRPYTYLTKSESTYDSSGQPAIKIECEKSNADCLQEAGFICVNNGYVVLHSESMDRGIVSNYTNNNSAVTVNKNYVVEKQNSSSESLNIQDHYMIIKCNNINSFDALKKFQDFRTQQEAEHHAEYNKTYCKNLGAENCESKSHSNKTPKRVLFGN